jgi:hypothetical protein
VGDGEVAGQEQLRVLGDDADRHRVVRGVHGGGVEHRALPARVLERELGGVLDLDRQRAGRRRAGHRCDRADEPAQQVERVDRLIHERPPPPPAQVPRHGEAS